MTYYKSFIVAVKDLQTNKIKIKHFDEDENAIRYVTTKYKDVTNMSYTIDLCDDIKEGFCRCDPCFYLLEFNIKNCLYFCNDDDCDCVSKVDFRCPINIDRTIEEIYRSDHYIISIYYQIITT